LIGLDNRYPLVSQMEEAPMTTIYQAFKAVELNAYEATDCSEQNTQLRVRLPTPKSEPNLRSSYIFPGERKTPRERPEPKPQR
jgi:hypothetical protein